MRLSGRWRRRARTIGASWEVELGSRRALRYLVGDDNGSSAQFPHELGRCNLGLQRGLVFHTAIGSRGSAEFFDPTGKNREWENCQLCKLRQFHGSPGYLSTQQV